MFLSLPSGIKNLKLKKWIFTLCAICIAFLIGCTNQNQSTFLEDEARNSLEELYVILAGDEQILENAAAILIIPKITSASFFVGGSYGEGILFIKDAAVEHYSIATASYGLELGASRFSQALIFMSSKALKEFRTTDGWELSADAYYSYRQRGKNLGISTNTLNDKFFISKPNPSQNFAELLTEALEAELRTPSTPAGALVDTSTATPKDFMDSIRRIETGDGISGAYSSFVGANLSDAIEPSHTVGSSTTPPRDTADVRAPESHEIYWFYYGDLVRAALEINDTIDVLTEKKMGIINYIYK